jgi:hypothetical protein
MTTTTQHLIAVVVKYLGATSFRGSRVKLSLPRFKASKTISYDYSFNSSEDIAEAYLNKNGIVPVGEADLGDEHLFLLSWDDIKKVESVLLS